MIGVGIFGGYVLLVEETTARVHMYKRAHQGQYIEKFSLVFVDMSASGRFMVSVCDAKNTSWMLWDVVAGAAIRRGSIQEPGSTRISLDEGFSCVAISPNEKTFATSGGRGVVVIWDLLTGGVQHILGATFILRDLPFPVDTLSFSCDGQRLASMCRTNEINIWDVSAGASTSVVKIHSIHPSSITPEPARQKCHSIKFSPTNPRMLATLSDIFIDVWDVDTGNRTSGFTGYGFISFLPDGVTIATSDRLAHLEDNYSIQYNDTRSGAIVSEITTDHEQRIQEAIFSSDGSTLLSVRPGGRSMFVSGIGVSDVEIHRIIDVPKYPPNSPNSIFPRVRGITSFTFGPDWVADRVLAFMMVHHPRLGAGSGMTTFTEEVLRMIKVHAGL
jgi:WD40 repeat protein